MRILLGIIIATVYISISTMPCYSFWNNLYWTMFFMFSHLFLTNTPFKNLMVVIRFFGNCSISEQSTPSHASQVLLFHIYVHIRVRSVKEFLDKGLTRNRPEAIQNLIPFCFNKNFVLTKILSNKWTLHNLQIQ